MKTEVYNQLCSIAGSDNVFRDEMMNKHTTFRVGGPAKCLVMLHSIDEISETVKLLSDNNEKFYLLGNGSNILVSDKGYDGTIIKIFKNFNDIKVDGNIIKAQAGALLSTIAAKAYDNSLTGFEFAAGIPGTVGGAVVMNAGAYGGEMKQVIVSALCMDKTGKIFELSNEELELSYRNSIISKKEYIVSEVTLELTKGNKDEIKATMDELKKRRVEKQPLEYPSAGSTFKRPEGHFAGKLIMDAGLAGYTVGGAQVSEKHCGFVINRDKATANDIIALIRDVQAKVKEEFDVDLETEVKMLGEF